MEIFFIVQVHVVAGYQLKFPTMAGKSNLLLKAALSNKIEQVKITLKRQPLLSHVNNEGDDALNLGVSNNNEQMVRVLVENGASTNNPRVRISPLILAIKLDLEEMAGVLVELGASLETGLLDGIQISPLRFAVRCLNLKMVMVLVAKGAKVRAKDPQNKRTALHEVGDYLNRSNPGLHTEIRIKMAVFLIKHKADICARDLNCRTPLDGAIIDNAELSKFFIKEGAPVRRTMNNGFLIEYVLYIVKFNIPELVRLCLERGGNYTHVALMDESFINAYHLALKDSHPNVVKAFWQFGCPIDLPFANASFVFKPDISKVKIAKINMTAYKIQRDFINGVDTNNISLVLSALERGAVARGTSMKVTSSLHHLAATKDANADVARVLLERGVPVNTLGSHVKKSSLFIAIEKTNVNIMKEILKFGGCFTKQDLEAARQSKNSQVQKIMDEITKAFKLTKIGSNKVLKMVEKRMKTEKKKEMAEILMSCVDSRGRSLLNLALEKGHVKIANRLMEIRVCNF